MHASSSSVCSGGSIGTPDSLPISRILARTSCRQASWKTVSVPGHPHVAYTYFGQTMSLREDVYHLLRGGWYVRVDRQPLIEILSMKRAPKAVHKGRTRTCTLCRVERYLTALAYVVASRACISDSLRSVSLSAWFTLSNAPQCAFAGHRKSNLLPTAKRRRTRTCCGGLFAPFQHLPH